MTEGERFTAALVVSLALHWSALHLPKVEDTQEPAINDETVVLDLTGEGLDVGMSLASPLVLEQAAFVPSPVAPNAASAEAAAERRRAALTRYVDEVSEAVHARRRISGAGRKLIGNAIVHIEIDSKGQFASLRLQRSSGDAELDADALQALQAASGVIPRPRILGEGALSLSFAVKYQFGL